MCYFKAPSLCHKEAGEQGGTRGFSGRMASVGGGPGRVPVGNSEVMVHTHLLSPSGQCETAGGQPQPSTLPPEHRSPPSHSAPW